MRKLVSVVAGIALALSLTPVHASYAGPLSIVMPSAAPACATRLPSAQAIQETKIEWAQYCPRGRYCVSWGYCWKNIFPGGKPFMCCKRWVCS